MIPVIADIPSINPGLGFKEYASALADAIRGGEPPQFTIGLYGPWGIGKSSLLNAILTDLKNDAGVLAILFDAWRYERSEHIIVPILYAVFEEIKKQNDKPLIDSMKRALFSVVNSLNFSIGKIGLQASAKDIRENWETNGLPALEEAFSKPFATMREIPNSLKGRRIVVLIDDLDRCSPDKIVSLLESINLIMDVSGFIFVLALDYDVLIQAISTKYPHVSGDAFIQKMVQLPFRVPPLNFSDVNLLPELIPNWEELHVNLPSDFRSCVYDVSILALDSNPRQIKRLINSYLLLHRVAEMRNLNINFELMTALIGVQLRWPAHYRDFLDAVIINDENPTAVFSADQKEPELSIYAERFFKKKYTAKDFREILQLTSVVVVSEENLSTLSPASELRESNKTEFIKKLESAGFKRSDRSERLFYCSRLPNVRFVLTKHVARFEKLQRDQWRLWESYLLTKEIEVALKVIEEPNTHFTNRK